MAISVETIKQHSMKVETIKKIRSYDELRKRIAIVSQNIESSKNMVTSFNKYRGNKLSGLSTIVLNQMSVLEGHQRSVGRLSLAMFSDKIMHHPIESEILGAADRIKEMRGKVDSLFNVNKNLMKIVAESEARDLGITRGGRRPVVLDHLMAAINFTSANGYWCYSYIAGFEFPETISGVNNNSTRSNPRYGLFYCLELSDVDSFDVLNLDNSIHGIPHTEAPKDDTPIDSESVVGSNPFMMKHRINHQYYDGGKFSYKSDACVWMLMTPTNYENSSRIKPVDHEVNIGKSNYWQLVAPLMSRLYAGQKRIDMVAKSYVVRDICNRVGLQYKESNGRFTKMDFPTYKTY